MTCISATSAGDGSYKLSNLTEGSYQITASATGFAPETFTVVVGPGGSPTQDFTLDAGPGTITGAVTDSVTLAAINGATVSCTGTPTCTGTTTNSNGNYTLTVAPGTYSIQVVQPEYTTGSQSNVVVTTGNPTPESFALVPNSGTISGTVTNSLTHAAIANAIVACTGTLACTSTTTLSDGTYTLSNLAEGSYDVTASATGYSPETVTAINVGPGGTPTQNFELAPLPGQITGHIYQSDGVTPISGATVACTGTLTCISATSAGDGDYKLSNLTEGSYQITASATGFAPETFTVVVGPGGSPTKDFNLNTSTGTLGVAKSFGSATTLGTGSATSVTATSTSGPTGAGDLLVVVIRSRTTGSVSTPVSGITNSSGTNVWSKPPAGLSVQKVQADEEIWYLPNAASVTSVTVTMSAATSFAVTVMDVTGTSATPLDLTATAVNTGSTQNSSVGPTPATTHANEIVIADIGWNSANSFAAGTTTAGYTLVPSQQSNVSGLAAGEQAAWLVVSTTGAQSFAGTLTSAFAWTGVIATFTSRRGRKR